MNEKKAEPIDIAKGQLIGIGKDSNGNKIAKFKTKLGKGFSIQTNGNLPILHKISNIGDIDDLAKVKKEVLAYIKDYGTKMQKQMVENTMKVIGEANTKTGVCPTCGSKYLLATNYCVKCKKKVKKEDKKIGKKKESTIIEIVNEVTIGTVILEKGDKIEILTESWDIMNDYDIAQEVKSLIGAALSEAVYSNEKKFKDFDALADDVDSNLNVDETDILNFNDSQTLDLCIYNEEETGSGIPNNTSWEEFQIVQAKAATFGLWTLVSSQLRDKLKVIDNTFTKQRIRFSEVGFSPSDSFRYFPPVRVTDVKGENVSVYQYRNIEGNTNVDVYEFHDLGLFGVVHV